MAIISLSGGLDSTTLLKFREDISLAISFKINTRQNVYELEAAKYFAEKYNVNHKIIDVSNIFSNSKGSKSCVSKSCGSSQVSIPFRNGVYLSILASIAESENIKKILLATHTGDRETYPDCRPRFNFAMFQAIELGTSNNVEFEAPFEKFTKLDIVKLAKKLDPEILTKTYSCYTGTLEPCGQCAPCIDRMVAISAISK